VPGKPKIKRVNMIDQVMEVIKERVLDRTYSPGCNLNVDELARELSVSATPIRESLGRLVAEGLLRAEPYVGFFVADIPSIEYFHQLYDYRLVVEPWAAAETARLRPAEQMAILQESVDAMREGVLSKRYARFRSFSEADETFHKAMIAGAGNEPAIKAYNHLMIHLHLSRLYIDRDLDTQESLSQHEAILEEIAAGEPERAASRIREHLLTSKDNLLGRAH
jgi:DNA-binding GntR family transcriptional regulator